MFTTEGYEIRAEKVMGTWLVSVRLRTADEEGGRGWDTLLQFQTSAHDWSDPHLEAESIALQVARRLQ